MSISLYEPYVPVSAYTRLRTNELKWWEKLMAFAQLHSAQNGSWNPPLLLRSCVFLKNFSWQNWLQQLRGSFGDLSTVGGKKSHSFSEFNRWQHGRLNRCITVFSSQREELQTWGEWRCTRLLKMHITLQPHRRTHHTLLDTCSKLSTFTDHFLPFLFGTGNCT